MYRAEAAEGGTVLVKKESQKKKGLKSQTVVKSKKEICKQRDLIRSGLPATWSCSARRNKTGPSTHNSLEPSRSAPTATSIYIEQLHFSDSRSYQISPARNGKRRPAPVTGIRPEEPHWPRRCQVGAMWHPLSPYRLRSLKMAPLLRFPEAFREKSSLPSALSGIFSWFRWLSRRPPPSSRRRSPRARRRAPAGSSKFAS
jgi:hypothetical protein